MADFANQTITLAGRKMLATAIAQKKQITFTKISCGDGQAPEAPEDLTALVNRIFDVGVAQVYKHDTEPGTFVVSGSFVATSDKGDFYFREAGIFARIDGEGDGEEILFAYLNAGDTADYIRSVSANSMTQIDLNFALVIGQAAVEYVYDPNALATLKAIDDAKTAVDEAIKQFTESTIADLKTQQDELIKKMDAAKAQLAKAEEGFLLKGGDTTTGDITMGEGTHLRGGVIGSLEGSATQWAGWQHFDTLDSFEGLSAATASVQQIAAKMPNYSTLTLVVTAQNNNMPEKIGLLEIRKSDNTLINALFTAFTGNAYTGAVYQNAFTGWRTTTPVPAGYGGIWYGAGNAPLGWLFCEGQLLKKTSYPALFNAIGTTWGSSGDSFKLPDTRGQFLRGWDNNRGLDPNRKLATDQQSAAPNIAGSLLICSGAISADGAFYTDNSKTTWFISSTIYGTLPLNKFDASRSSAVYKSGITEVRPTNISARYIIKY